MNKCAFIAIMVLAMAVRLALFLSAPDTGAFCTDDSSSYQRLAGNMIVIHAFREDHLDPPARTEIFRTPGYPAFVALIGEVGTVARGRAWTVEGDLPEWGTWWSVLCQVALDVVLVGLTCLLGARLAGTGAGCLAGLFQALSPLAIASSCRLLSDSLYAFVFAVAILFMVAYLRGGGWRMLIASAIALGAASYVRPVGLAMAPIFALAALIRSTRRAKPEGLEFTSPGRSPGEGTADDAKPCKGETNALSSPFRASDEQGSGTQGFALGWRMRALQALKIATGRAARALVFLLVFAACLAPWIIRNGVRANYWGFSSAYGDTLYTFAAPRVLLQSDPNWILYTAEMHLHERRAWFEWFLGREPTPEESAAWRRREALHIIAAHPWTYAKLHAKGCVAFWLPATDALEVAGLTEGGKGTLAVLRKEGVWAAIANYFGDNWKAVALAVPIALFTLVQYAGAVFCAARGIRRTRFRLPAEVWLLALVVLVSAAMPGVVAHPRFRVPIEPILNVAAAAGLLSLFRRKAERA